MPEMISYIFGTLEATERTLRRQSKFNKGVMLFSAAIGAYAYLQSKKIKELETKVETLRCEKENGGYEM